MKSVILNLSEREKILFIFRQGDIFDAEKV